MYVAFALLGFVAWCPDCADTTSWWKGGGGLHFAYFIKLVVSRCLVLFLLASVSFSVSLFLIDRKVRYSHHEQESLSSVETNKY